MQKKIYRKFQNFMLMGSIFVVTFSFYIEMLNQLEPCPLCFMQRGCSFLFGFLCMYGLFVESLKRARFISLLQCIIGGLGLYFASRQLWLQTLPADMSGQCMPGLQAMIHFFSWDMILKSFFWGSSDCSHVDWQWLGLSTPVWSALYFFTMVVLSVYMYVTAFFTMRHQTKF